MPRLTKVCVGLRACGGAPEIAPPQSAHRRLRQTFTSRLAVVTNIIL